MEDTTCYITNLPSDLLQRVFELHATELTDSEGGLKEFAQLCLVCKKFNNAITSESIRESLFMGTMLQKFAKHHLPKKFEEEFQRRNLPAFSRLCKAAEAQNSAYATKISAEYFLKAVEEATVPFVKDYVAVGPQSTSAWTVLSHDNILHAIEVANQRTDDNFAMLLYLLPSLFARLPDADPHHIFAIVQQIMSGHKLTIEAEFKAQITHLLTEQLKAVASPAAILKRKRSDVLLNFLDPNEQKIWRAALQFFKALSASNFDEIKRIFDENRLDPAHPSLQAPNVLLAYLKNNQTANGDIVNWILDKELPFQVNSKLIFALLQSSGVKIETVMRVWDKRSGSIDIAELVQKLLRKLAKRAAANDHVVTSQFFKADYTPINLVNLAWRFGNEENYLKVLPVEIIEMICERTPCLTLWEEILQYFLEKNSNKVDFDAALLDPAPTQLQVVFGRFLHNNFDKVTIHSHWKLLQLLFRRLRLEKQFLREVFALLRHYIPKLKTVFVHYSHELHDLFHLCLASSEIPAFGELPRLAERRDRFAFAVLKALLDIEPLRNYHADLKTCKYDREKFPCFWTAILQKNVRAVKFLVNKKWMPLQKPDPNATSAADYAIACGNPELVECLSIQGTTAESSGSLALPTSTELNN